LGQGLLNRTPPIHKFWDRPPESLKPSVERVRPAFDRAVATASDESQPLERRAAAARLLGFGPFRAAEKGCAPLLSPRQPAELQSASARALARHDDPAVAELLIAAWPGFGPTLRREAVEALTATPTRGAALIDAIESNRVPAAQVEAARLEQFAKHPDTRVRERAHALLARRGTADRKKVLEDYRPVLTLTGDAERGRAAFKKVCATCHQFGPDGVEVGPDLRSAVRNKTAEDLLVAVLDPNREIDPRYVNYTVSTKAGRDDAGEDAAETPASLTLRRAERAEDTILRGQIDEVQATAKSLMPEELEKQLSRQDLADLFAYLLAPDRKD
jgi:putative heme-binding domain-containing protein